MQFFLALHNFVNWARKKWKLKKNKRPSERRLNVRVGWPEECRAANNRQVEKERGNEAMLEKDVSPATFWRDSVVLRNRLDASAISFQPNSTHDCVTSTSSFLHLPFYSTQVNSRYSPGFLSGAKAWTQLDVARYRDRRGKNSEEKRKSSWIWLVADENVHQCRLF